MDKLITLISENFALILSTFVSILAIVTSIYQSHNSKRTRAMEMYFSSQLEAYNEFLDAVVRLEIPLTQENKNNQHIFISASQKAMMLSTPLTASIINDFCSTYATLIKDVSSGEPSDNIVALFALEKGRLIKQLNIELSKYDKNLVNKANKYKHRKCK